MKYLKTSILITSLITMSLQQESVIATTTDTVVGNVLTLDNVSHVMNEERFVGDTIAVEKARLAKIEEELARQTTEYREKLRIEAEEKARIEAEHEDYTYESINEYLNNTALSGMAETFVTVATEYDVPVSILLGITIQETGWGKSELFVSDNNPGGIKCTDRASYCVGDFSGYSSKYDGISDKAYLLRTYYFDEGLDTLPEIQGKYCPSYDGGCDVWVQNVSQFVYEIESLN